MAGDSTLELENLSDTAHDDDNSANGKGHITDADIQSTSSEKERLLSDWEDASDGVLSSSKRKRNALSNSSRVAILILGVVLSVILGISLFLYLRANHESTSDEIQGNDYLLDSHWDLSSPPQRREFYWTVRDVMHNPDGIYRPMVVINNQFPGPFVEANEGDTIVVHVDNQAVNATAIHWHGIYQNGTPYMDGTVGISQCPIAPGKQFTYEFTVTGQSGTYWWHAHYGVQSSDGLHGPLVIHSRDERRLQKIEYATDRVVLVSDHYHDLSSALLWQYLKPDMENAEPVPKSGLINGRGKRDCNEFPDRKCDDTSSLASFSFEPNQAHRIRFINVGAFADFQIQIDKHELTVTEVDGTDVLPINYHRISISPAQRYSVIVSANASAGDSFWLRARMITQCFTDPPDDLQPEVRAIVRYNHGNAKSNELPSSQDWNEMLQDECKDMNATELVPVEAISPPKRPDAFFYLRSNFEIGAYRLSRGFFNSSSWRPEIRSPSLPRVVQGMKKRDPAFHQASEVHEGGAAFVNDAAFDISRELVVQSPGIHTIDVLVSNFDDGDHPLHLHGYKYWVLAGGQGYPPLTHVGADINLETLAPLYKSLNLENPLRRDTASVTAFGWILLRFVADNPGAWAFHCHLSWHSEAGLLMQFITRSDELVNMEIPQANKQLCSGLGLEKGSGPHDEDYRDLAR